MEKIPHIPSASVEHTFPIQASDTLARLAGPATSMDILQWKDNTNHIIKKWKELVSIKGGTANDEDPSLKIIVEHYLDRFEKEAVEKDKWQLLIKTLNEYDVPMESIQSFQKFRLLCEIGYLPPPPANVIEPTSSTSAFESLERP